MEYSTSAKQSATLLGILVILISVITAGFAGSAAGSTTAVQGGPTNLIDSASVTYTTDADQIGGTYTATVTFEKNITQVGTPSEVMNAFEIGNDNATLNYNEDDPGSNVTVDEANNKITLILTETGNINSATNFSKSNDDGLQYNGSAGNDPIYTEGDSISDFNVTLTNDIAPVIDKVADPSIPHLAVADSEARSTNASTLDFYYNEYVTLDAAKAEDAFGFTGDDAPTIRDVELVVPTGGRSQGITLFFQNAVKPGDDLGKLTYNGSDAVASSASGKAAQSSQEASINLTVANVVSARPEIQRVVFDDVPENTDGDTTGEMLLYFDSRVNAQRDGGDNTSGLSFDSDSTSVSINVDGSITDDYHEQPDNVVAVKFSSASGSVASLVREGDTFGSNAELSVDTSKGLNITYNDTGRNIAATDVKAENISNEIAGNLSEVNKTSSDIEILGADVDEQEGTYDVTVSGLSDGENQVLDETISVNVAGTSTEIPASTVGTEFRFDNEYTVSLPSNGSVNSNIGETVPINVTNENGTELRPNNPATVEIAHEARVTTAPTSSTFIVSLPQPGEIVADSDIGAVNSYNATSGEMESYASMDATDRVHRGIFIDGNGTGNVYGFTYETEAANVGGTTAAMPEGWNLVGSNTALSDTFPTTYDEDLRFDTNPAVSSDDVRLFATNNVGSNNVGTTIQTVASHDDSGINEYDAYYVYMHESNDRVIIEPGY